MDFDLAAGISVLERTPHVFRAMLDGLPPVGVDATEGPETWSPYIIVGHLIHGEQTDWIPRAQIILAQGPQRRFAPYDRFAQFRESQGRALDDPTCRSWIADDQRTRGSRRHLINIGSVRRWDAQSQTWSADPQLRHRSTDFHWHTA